ncbi:unnamed protein product [Prunus brigantina]
MLPQIPPSFCLAHMLQGEDVKYSSGFPTLFGFPLRSWRSVLLVEERTCRVHQAGWARLVVVVTTKSGWSDGVNCCTIIMSSDEGIQSSDSQVPKCLWGGSKVMKRRFVANLHCITTESQFQKWCATFAFAIASNVHVGLAEPSTKCVARVHLP